MKVRYLFEAQIDLQNIHRYIEERNPRAAAEVIARIRTLPTVSAFGGTWVISAVFQEPMSGQSLDCLTSSFTK
jgi:hypothetical protein